MDDLATTHLTASHELLLRGIKRPYRRSSMTLLSNFETQRAIVLLRKVIEVGSGARQPAVSPAFRQHVDLARPRPRILRRGALHHGRSPAGWAFWGVIHGLRGPGGTVLR